MERKDKNVTTVVKKKTTPIVKKEVVKKPVPKVENKVEEIKKPIILPDPVEVKKEDVVKEENVEVVDERNLRKGTRIQLRYKKIGGGSLRMTVDGIKKIIKPNQIFTAYPSDIPKIFSDLVQCIDDEEVQKLVIEEKPFHVKEELYLIKELTPGGWHVLNGKTKKPLQDKPLTKEEATVLMNSLNS